MLLTYRHNCFIFFSECQSKCTSGVSRTATLRGDQLHRMSIHRGRVRSRAWLQRQRWRVQTPPAAVFQRLVSRVDIVSGMEGLKMVCVAFQEFLRPVMSAAITGKKIYLVTKMGRYNKYRTMQYTHIHSHTHTRDVGQYLAGWPPRKTIRAYE
jgi:hypothetical protein